MDISKFWKELYDFDFNTRYNLHLLILDRSWGSDPGHFFFRPNVKEFLIWY